MKNNFLSLLSLALVFALTGMFTNANATTNPEKEIKLVFVDHLTAGLIEQDVFVERVIGSSEVYRVLPGERDKYINAPIYKSKKTLKHDPFDASKNGPYEKGEAFGMTLNQWLKAKGTGSYACEEGWGTLTATFEGLMPNAVYTMWHFFMPAPITEPFTGTLDVPVGDRDGSDAVFVTDENGNATLNLKFERCLQMQEVQLAAGLAIAYHSDGKTYESDPGPFGSNTHVQLFAMLPEAEKPLKQDY